jgi:hypothetical protein
MTEIHVGTRCLKPSIREVRNEGTRGMDMGENGERRTTMQERR